MAFDENLFISRSVLGYNEMVKEAGTKLGNDPSKWEQELVSAFHEQHPYMKDAQLRISIHKTDKDSGTLVGQIVIGEKASVPVIVDRSKIHPFDLFLHEGKLRPLTKEALLDLVQPTSMGTVLPPGSGETSDVSIFNMTQPPFSGKYSFAESLEFTLDEYEKALQQLGPEGLNYAIINCRPFSKVASRYAACASLKKEAAAPALKYVVSPVDVDLFLPISETGTYEVLVGGMAKKAGIVIDKVIDLRDGCSEINDKLFCSFDGKVALASDMGGRPASAPDSSFKDDPRKPGYGFFWMYKEGEFVATKPVRILYCGESEKGSFLKVADYRPEGGELTVWPSINYTGLLVRGNDITMGPEWNWKACSPEIIKVASAATANAAVWPECVEICNSGVTWQLRGLDAGVPQDGDTMENFFVKVAGLVGFDAAMELMGKAEKTGSAFFAVEEKKQVLPRVVNFTPVNLVKEATFIAPLADAWLEKTALTVSPEQADTTVDTMLGMSFMTPENIMKFVDRIDVVEEAMDVLSKLLLASRLGMPVDGSPVRTALFALDSVMRQMQHLRSMSAGDEE